MERTEHRRLVQLSPRSIFCLLIQLFVPSCSPSPPGEYRAEDVGFAYPSGWHIEDERTAPEDPRYRSATAKGSDGAIIMFARFPAEEDALTLEGFAALMSASIGAEVKKILSPGKLEIADVRGGSYRQVQVRIAGQTLGALEQDMQMKLLGIEVPFCLQFNRFEYTGTLVFVYAHVREDKLQGTQAELRKVDDLIHYTGTEG